MDSTISSAQVQPEELPPLFIHDCVKLPAYAVGYPWLSRVGAAVEFVFPEVSKLASVIINTAIPAQDRVISDTARKCCPLFSSRKVYRLFGVSSILWSEEYGFRL